jgi:hypothetical protein
MQATRLHKILQSNSSEKSYDMTVKGKMACPEYVDTESGLKINSNARNHDTAIADILVSQKMPPHIIRILQETEKQKTLKIRIADDGKKNVSANFQGQLMSMSFVI